MGAPRGRFLGPARLLGRVAVGVGLVAGGFVLGARADRPQGGAPPSVGAEPVVEAAPDPASRPERPGDRSAPGPVEGPGESASTARRPEARGAGEPAEPISDVARPRPERRDHERGPDTSSEQGEDPGAPEDGGPLGEPTEEDPEASEERDPGLGSLNGPPDPEP